MTDDIVTRLRKIARIHEGRVGHDCINDAADEIERLRAEVETYKDLYASEIVKKAVHGE